MRLVQHMPCSVLHAGPLFSLRDRLMAVWPFAEPLWLSLEVRPLGCEACSCMLPVLAGLEGEPHTTEA